MKTSTQINLNYEEISKAINIKSPLFPVPDGTQLHSDRLCSMEIWVASAKGWPQNLDMRSASRKSET